MKKAIFCITAAIAGIAVGRKVGSLMSRRSFKRVMQLANSETQVYAPDYIKQHAPDVRHVVPENMKECAVDKSVNNGNAMYINSKICSKINASKSILSHEVGHHHNKEQALTPTLIREINAWKNGPKDVGKHYDEIKTNALRTYIRPVAGAFCGALIGICASLLLTRSDLNQ